MSVQVAKALDRMVGGLLLRAVGPLRAVQDILSPEPPLDAIREVAAVKFWGIGNAALLLPVLGRLRERYPAARLTALTLAGNEPLLRGAADRVIAVRPRPLAATLSDLLRALATLRRPRIDLAIDFEQYVRTSQLLLWAAGARQIVAFETAGQRRAGLAHVRVPYDDAQHTALSYLDLARAGGVREGTYRPGGLQIEQAAARRVGEWCRAAGVGPRPLVVLHPGSGDNFPGRRWPIRRFALLARRLRDEADAVLAITGSRGEAPLVRQIEEASGRPVWGLAGRCTLPELVALLARAALLVSNDTGPVHLASALGVPVLGLYGPNVPHLYGPLSAGSVAFYDAPPCSPCITNFNYKTSRCRNPVCIQAIGLDEVAEAALARLRAKIAHREERSA